MVYSFEVPAYFWDGRRKRLASYVVSHGYTYIAFFDCGYDSSGTKGATSTGAGRRGGEGEGEETRTR